MGAAASFSYAAWQAQFPALAAVPSDTVLAYWNQAGTYFANDGSGPVSTVAQQQSLMNLVTAHLLLIFGAVTLGANGTITTDPVGRISSASEGSVSVSTENQYPPGTPQWWQQTAFGSAFYMATAPYRTMRYRPGPRRRFNPPFIGGGPFGGRGW